MTENTTLLTAAEGAALIGRPRSFAPATSPAKPASFITAEDREQRIAKRFADDTAQHAMSILHDDGLYRHLRFTSNPRGYGEYWFDLITWPGCLTIRGDYGDAYTFTRERDMLPFFRADRRWGINPYYWAQKLDGHRDSAQEYSEDVFKQIVTELFVSAVQCGDAPRGLGKAVRAEILNRELPDEREARDLLESFEFKGFDFGETWEFGFRDYERSFLWACHAILWGIRRYDKVTRYGLRKLATPKPVPELADAQLAGAVLDAVTEGGAS
jgi:hypothetical protein